MNRPSPLLLIAAVAALAGAVAAPAAAAPASRSRGVTVLDPTVNGETRPPPSESVPAPAPPPPPVQTQAQPAPAPKACERAFATADLAYADTNGFDTALAAKLTASSADQGVVIDTPPFAPDTALPRLVGWLSTIQTSGGEVNRRDITCSRGFNLMRLLRSIFAPPPKPDLYAPARAYNAVFWIDQGSGKVRQVQFVRRTPA